MKATKNSYRQFHYKWWKNTGIQKLILFKIDAIWKYWGCHHKKRCFSYLLANLHWNSLNTWFFSNYKKKQISSKFWMPDQKLLRFQFVFFRSWCFRSCPVSLENMNGINEMEYKYFSSCYGKVRIWFKWIFNFI